MSMMRECGDSRRAEPPCPRRSWGRLEAFARDQRGATAVEFAFISLPFFGLIFAIVQVSLFLFLSGALQTALLETARPLWTRENASALLTYEAFKDRLCSRMPMFDCDKLRMQMQAYSDISAVQPDRYDRRCFDNGDASAEICFNPGGARDFVVLRVGYEWPFGLGLADFNGTTMLINTAVFRNESF